MKYFASVSFGKDSLAMLLIIIEKGPPLDEVVFYDTEMEFQAIYDTRDKVVPILKENGIKYTELHPRVSFMKKMFDIKVRNKQGGIHYGYSWCGGTCRWGTTDKLVSMKKYIGKNFDYVGIASDEVKRIKKESRKNRILPLVNFGITESEALEYCYSKGFFWEEQGIRLYDILDRVSCWCCSNKNNRELIGIYKKLPNYFEKLKDLESRNRLRFRESKGQSIFDIEDKIKSRKLRYVNKSKINPNQLRLKL